MLTVREDNVTTASPIKVCMHVMGTFRIDVRAKRAANALRVGGYEVSVIDVASQRSFAKEEEDIDGIAVNHMLMPVSFTATATRFKRGALFRSGWMFLCSTLRLLRTTTDVFHALDLSALPACYVASRVRRKPLIFESYELPLSTLPLSAISRGRRWLQAIMAPLLKHIIPRCAGVIAVSPPIVEELRKRYPGSTISLLRNILPYQAVAKSDRLRQRLGLDLHVRIALYQGSLQTDRGLDCLIRAAAFLKQDVVIVLMGNGPSETVSQLEELIARVGVAEHVKILPSVPYEELLDWTASADIGLLIYSPDFSLNVRMCLPNKLFEFLMAGLPVLASQLDAVAEVINTYDVGLIVPSLAPADIGAMINTMLTDTDELKRMHFNALRAALQELHWEKERQELTHLYADVLAKTRQM